SLPQRLCYFAASFFFFGIPRLLFFLAPIGFMLLGVKPIDASILSVVVMFLPHILAGWFVVSGVSRNIRHTFWSEVYECAVSWHMAVSVMWTLFTRKKLPFKVTPKDVRRDRISWNARAALPQMVLLALTLVSLGMGANLFRHGWEQGGVTAMNLVWLAYNALLLTAAVAVSIDRPQRRAAPRLPVHLPALLRWSLRGRHLEVEGVAVDLSETGARILLRSAVPPGVELELQLGSGAERVRIPSKLVSCRPGEDGHVHGAGLEFEPLEEEARIQLIRWMYCDPDTWSRGQQLAAPWQAFVKLAGSPFRAVRTQEIELQRRAPRQEGRRHVLLNRENLPAQQAWVADLSLGGAKAVLDHGRLKPGETLSLVLPLRSGASLDLQAEVMANRGGRSWGLRFRELDAEERADLLWDLFVSPLGEAGSPRSMQALQGGRGLGEQGSRPAV
ncbi:MAG: PilZ domain-containing protein, partial [Planctomycetes bacterium]|nr:PilZ domain-containing protein [Planctomycetota bacterium]